jgi:heterotetrameric sarcosine oxidase gamma subunit
MTHSPLAARQALPQLRIEEGAKEHDVRVVSRDRVGIATVIARNNSATALVELVHANYGLELPLGPWRASCHGVTFAGTGPGIWLATRDGDENDFAPSLKESVGLHASVSDQTAAYAILNLRGAKVRDVLSTLVPIDVHERAFKVGHVAVTTSAQVLATLWRLDDQPNGCAQFEIAVYRSYAASFWHALARLLDFKN